MDVEAVIRRLESLQDQWEDDIAERHTPGDHSEFEGTEPSSMNTTWTHQVMLRTTREAWLLGMAVGYANAYREAADLLRGGPRPGGITFTAQGPIHRSG